MIEALKGDEIVSKVGGRFHLTALVQHRVRELMGGARPLIERGHRTDIEVAIDEIMQGKIVIGGLEGSQDDGSDDDDTID